MSSTTTPLISIENLIERFEPELENITQPLVADFLSQLQDIVASNNSLILKPINDLLSLTFFVDDYQRGYKWTSLQVVDLLNDINEFEISDKGFYCLQPVVVKHHKAEMSGEKGCWELIDGQQRMTTVFMILKYLGHSLVFNIDYQTRESSSDFLKNYLKETLEFDHWDGFINRSNVPSNFDNVDNYHFYEAYKTIHCWFKNNLSDEDKKTWLDKLLNHTKVIWYAARDEKGVINKTSSIDVFMRINSGKIPLTNSELIKALFLQGITGGDKSSLALLKQSELSQQWDVIEHGLQNDEFWGFLSGSKNDGEDSTRIDLLFNLVSSKYKQKSPGKTALSSQDDYNAFNYFSEQLKDKNGDALQNSVSESWHEVKEGYFRLLEWFSDDELYHLVGFLINRNWVSIQYLWQKSLKKDKSEFKNDLKTEIALKIRRFFFSTESEELDFSNLNYEPKNRSAITSILMLLNIDAHRTNKTRLSFKTYQTKWDIEHIHAQQSQDLIGEAKTIAWLTEQESMLNGAVGHVRQEQLESLKKALTNYSAALEAGNENNHVKQLLNTYDQMFSETFGEMKDENVNGLENLCLLPPKVNRGIGNHVFTLKREKIIEYERERNFIPVATKNVFSKFYSPQVVHMHQWTKDDREAYKKSIIQALSYYGDMEGLV